jgi:hypothetical protein
MLVCVSRHLLRSRVLAGFNPLNALEQSMQDDMMQREAAKEESDHSVETAFISPFMMAIRKWHRNDEVGSTSSAARLASVCPMANGL